MLLQCPKEYDIAFVGGVDTEKRSRVLQNLHERGLRVHHIERWGEDRDQEIAKCKILLNIHYDHDYTIFEAIRCERWIFAGMPVLTESCSNKLYEHPCLFIADYNNLVEKSIELISVTDTIQPIYDKFQIERYTYIDEFKKHINNF